MTSSNNERLPGNRHFDCINKCQKYIWGCKDKCYLLSQLNVAPQPSTADTNAMAAPSQEGVGQGEAASAAPDQQRATATYWLIEHTASSPREYLVLNPPEQVAYWTRVPNLATKFLTQWQADAAARNYCAACNYREYTESHEHMDCLGPTAPRQETSMEDMSQPHAGKIVQTVTTYDTSAAPSAGVTLTEEQIEMMRKEFRSYATEGDDLDQLCDLALDGLRSKP